MPLHSSVAALAIRSLHDEGMCTRELQGRARILTSQLSGGSGSTEAGSMTGGRPVSSGSFLAVDSPLGGGMDL